LPRDKATTFSIDCVTTSAKFRAADNLEKTRRPPAALVVGNRGLVCADFHSMKV
jgi:hypothetical protein